MSLFVWKTEYSVGCVNIDREHEQLFHIADELHRAMMERRGKEILDGLLKRLIAYTSYHFGNEERLMHDSAYPLYLQHRIEHAKLTAQVLDYQKRLLDGGTILSVDVMNFLSAWLKHHIQGSDQKLSAHLSRSCKVQN
jgi:hemerythrin